MKRLLLNILMCLTLAIPASGQTAFRTAELQRLATVMGLDVTSLPEGYSHPQAQGLSLTVHKASGIVDHIGRWLFADEVRQQGRMPVLNFFGRYRSALTGLITTSLSKATGFTRYSSST